MNKLKPENNPVESKDLTAKLTIMDKVQSDIIESNHRLMIDHASLTQTVGNFSFRINHLDPMYEEDIKEIINDNKEDIMDTIDSLKTNLDQLGNDLNQQSDNFKDLQEKVAGLAEIRLQQIENKPTNLVSQINTISSVVNWLVRSIHTHSFSKDFDSFSTQLKMWGKIIEVNKITNLVPDHINLQSAIRRNFMLYRI